MKGTDAELAECRLVQVNLAPSLNLAFHVNAIPLIRDLVVNAPEDRDLRSVVLTMEADPPFARQAVWNIDAVPAGGSRRLMRCDTVLDAKLFAGLKEATTACVSFVLKADDQGLWRETVELRLLARDEWGGISNLPEILCAFVRPNDPTVETINKKAAEDPRSRGKASGLDGYLSESREKAWEITSALWAAIVALRIDYSVPPATGSALRCAYRAVVCTCVWPSSFPIIGRPWPAHPHDRSKRPTVVGASARFQTDPARHRGNTGAVG